MESGAGVTAASPGQGDGMRVRSPLLEAFPGILHGFSTRRGGVSRSPIATLNLGTSVGDDPEAVRENRHRFFGGLGVGPAQVIRAKQVHGNGVLVVDGSLTSRQGFPQVLLDEGYKFDALVTTLPELALAVSTADCTPILIFDPIHRAAAAVHAGWPSTAKRIVVETLTTLQRVHGTNPADCRVAIGPSIRGCCYEVDAPVTTAMAGALSNWEAHAVPTRSGHWRLDLAQVNRALLESAGVPASQIEDLEVCTACRTDLFFSHRAEKGRTGRMLNFILMREQS